MAKLYVENMEQKIIYLSEMSGQISDGMWENARPYDHYKFWSDIEFDDVIINPSKLGYIREMGDFRVIKDNYNFANKSLLDIVGDRIVTRINIYKFFGYPVVKMLCSDTLSSLETSEDFLRIEQMIESGHASKYYIEQLNIAKKTGLTYDVMKEMEDKPRYTRKDLVKDCKRLNIMVRTLRGNADSLLNQKDISVNDMEALLAE